MALELTQARQRLTRWLSWPKAAGLAVLGYQAEQIALEGKPLDSGLLTLAATCFFASRAGLLQEARNERRKR